MGLRSGVERVQDAEDDSGVLRLVHNFFVRRLGSQDAEDMVQEVALRLHQRQAESRIESPEGYAVQVARSVLTDRWRRESVRQRDRHVTLEDYHHPVEDISPARVLEGKERLTQVLRSLEELPDRTRQVFVLHRFEELSYAAIASHMEISVSAVEKHIMKAIKHLAKRMGD